MSIIEGIGDEVLYLSLVIFILLALYLTWLSTSVSSSSFTYVVAIDNALFSNIFGRFTGTSTEADAANEISQSSVDETSLSEPTVSQSEDVEQPITGEAEQTNETSEEMQRDCDNQIDCNKSDNAQISDISEQSCPVLAEDLTEKVVERKDANNGIPAGHMRIRLQYIDGKQKTVFARPEETVGEFKRRNFSLELGAQSIVRFIMGGRELKNDSTSLQLYNVKHDDVVHCLVSNVRPAEGSSQLSSSNGMRQRGAPDIGSLVFPIFGLALAIIWYARIFHRGYFNGTSTFSLVAITFLYILSVLASYRVVSQNDNIGHLHQD